MEHVHTYKIPTKRMRFGANSQQRVGFEELHVFRWPGGGG